MLFQAAKNAGGVVFVPAFLFPFMPGSGGFFKRDCFFRDDTTGINAVSKIGQISITGGACIGHLKRQYWEPFGAIQQYRPLPSLSLIIFPFSVSGFVLRILVSVNLMVASSRTGINSHRTGYTRFYTRVKFILANEQ